jgi:hypothetical protein
MSSLSRGVDEGRNCDSYIHAIHVYVSPRISFSFPSPFDNAWDVVRILHFEATTLDQHNTIYILFKLIERNFMRIIQMMIVVHFDILISMFTTTIILIMFKISQQLQQCVWRCNSRNVA